MRRRTPIIKAYISAYLKQRPKSISLKTYFLPTSQLFKILLNQFFCKAIAQKALFYVLGMRKLELFMDILDNRGAPIHKLFLVTLLLSIIS